MKRKTPVAALIAIIVLAAAWNTPSADPFTEKGLSPAAVIVTDRSADTFNEVRSLLKAKGARALQIFPPDVIFGYFPSSLDDSDFSGLAVSIVESPAELVPGMCDPTMDAVVRGLFNGREHLHDAATPDPSLRFRDLIVGIPEEVRAKHRVKGGPRMGAPREIAARGMEQNSEFLIGTVLVNVIFPESVGGDENWTEDELSTAIVDIATGCSNYQQLAHWVELDFAFNFYKSVPVTMEPILGDWNSDPYWISETMDYLDIQDDYYVSRVHYLNNETRIRPEFNTDWVFTAFVVDASENVCWQGPNGFYVAYTISLGGPFIVVPFPACRFGEGVGFAHVFIHEMSHVFYALDEYMVDNPDLAMHDCDAHSGYLAIPNRNTLIRQCQPVIDCIMNNAQLSYPLPVCPWTLGQVGLWDENENSIPDLYEVPPTVEFLDIPGVSYDTVVTNNTVIAARATNEAVENRNPDQSPGTRINYAPRLVKGTYWINSGFDTPIIPTDRVWDESREDIGFIFSGLAPGLNVLNIRVENHVGLTAEATQEIYYIGIKYNTITASVEHDHIDLTWKTAREVFDAVFDVVREDLTTGGGEVVLTSIDTCTTCGTLQNQYEYRDDAIMPGHEYRYYVEAHFDITYKGKPEHFDVVSKSIYKTAMLPVGAELTSTLLPNPTTGRTSFTVNIPETYDDPTGGSRASRSGSGSLGAPALNLVMTPVDIAVYNVLGQRIRTIYSRKKFGGLETYTWNGLDDRGAQVPQGVYFIRIVAGDRKAVKKVVVLR